jgi:hypothetical protein
MATTTQIATFKRLARRVHALWRSPFYGKNPMDHPYHRELKAYYKRLNKIESAMDAIEECMTEEQIADVESWAYKNELFGVLGTC